MFLGKYMFTYQIKSTSDAGVTRQDAAETEVVTEVTSATTVDVNFMPNESRSCYQEEI